VILWRALSLELGNLLRGGGVVVAAVDVASEAYQRKNVHFHQQFPSRFATALFLRLLFRIQRIAQGRRVASLKCTLHLSDERCCEEKLRR
jgi:hypothetical protein